MTSTPWYTTEELCHQLAISRSTLFALRKSGLLNDGCQATSKSLERHGHLALDPEVREKLMHSSTRRRSSGAKNTNPPSH